MLGLVTDGEGEEEDRYVLGTKGAEYEKLYKRAAQSVKAPEPIVPKKTAGSASGQEKKEEEELKEGAMPKHWTSAGGKGLFLKEGQLKVHSGDGQMQLILRGGGIEVSSGGSLTFSGESIGTGQEKAKKVTFSGEEYLFLKQKEEKLLLTEESVEAKGTEIGIN